jgi:myosin heavy subunit
VLTARYAAHLHPSPTPDPLMQVEYTVDGFLSKCKDRMPEDLAHLMGESQMPLLSEVTTMSIASTTSSSLH